MDKTHKTLFDVWISRIGCILYGIMMVLIMLHSFLYHGWTHWAGEIIYILDEYGYRTFLIILVWLSITVELGLSWKRAVGAAFLILIYWLLNITHGNTLLIELVLLAILSNMMRQKAIGCVWLMVHGLYILILLILNNNGLVSAVYTGESKIIGLDHLGSSFGMGHPNSIAIFIMSTLLMIWILLNPKNKWITPVMFVVGTAVVFWLTLCRTVCILMLLFPLLLWGVEKFSEQQKQWKTAVITCLPIVMILASLICSIYALSRAEGYPPGAFWMRFTELKQVLEYFHLPFGAFDKAGYTNLYFDNFYYWLIAFCGVIPAIATVAAGCWMNGRLFRKQKIKLLSVSILFLFYSLMENAIIYPIYYFVPLLAFCKDEIDTSNIRRA